MQTRQPRRAVLPLRQAAPLGGRTGSINCHWGGPSNDAYRHCVGLDFSLWPCCRARRDSGRTTSAASLVTSGLLLFCCCVARLGWGFVTKYRYRYYRGLMSQVCLQPSTTTCTIPIDRNPASPQQPLATRTAFPVLRSLPTPRNLYGFDEQPGTNNSTAGHLAMSLLLHPTLTV